MLLKGKGKIKVNVSANGGLSDSVCHWSKVNIGVSCGEFPINIKLFSYIFQKLFLSRYKLWKNSIC